MKSFKQRLKKQESLHSNTDWNKYDERLLRAVEKGDVEKVAATLKKGAVATKQDAEGCSALHLTACKGLINSLNVFLAHGVNLYSTDAAGKTALHLSASGGHSACVQRLLQCKSPVDSTDLQGRTALHEAAYAGHTTIVKLLCGSGASVSAVDKDGRSPLILAARMGHSRACQHLLNSGASINLRDKQNKTALILACKHRCREVVEVLLKHKADVTAVDVFGHDAFHYACLTEDQALIKQVKQALEATSKGINASRTSQKMQHQRSINNEAQAHVKMSTAQSPPKSPTSEVVMPERAASLKHKKEHSSHSVVGKDVPQGQYMDFTQVQHPVLHSAAPGLDETEILRMELMEALRRHEAANDEVRRLDAALNLRARDFEELRTSSELALQEAHKHAWELEDALSEVQRRMTGSEARVRQMQAHLVGMREKLAEELGAQLFEARAELERTRQELGRSRKETREHRERSVTLEQEVLRLNEELTSKDGDASAPHADLETLKAQRMTASKEIQTPSDWKPASSKTTMTDLTADILQREMDKKGYISLDEHEAVRRSLGSKLELSESQAQTALLKLKRSEEENQNLLTELREQKSELDVLQEALHARFVPVSRLEEKDRELDELKLKLERMQESKRKEQNIENQERQEDSWKEGSPKSTKDSRDPQSRDSLNDSKKLGDMLADPSEEKNKNSEIALETEDQREAQSSSSAPSSPCGLQHSDSVSLLAHINSLKQQLENSEKHYREVLDVYRTRLLSAAQGFMDDEARVALLQIAQMRQECVC